MKILMVHPHDPYCHPWMIRPLKFAEHLIRRGHQITLAHLPDPDYRKKTGLIHKDMPEGLELIELDWPRRSFLKNAKTLINAGHDADILHIQKCTSNTVLPALLAVQKLEIPLHYDWDDWECAIARDMGVSGTDLLDIQYYEQLLPLACDTLSGASQTLRDLSAERGMPEDRIVSAPVGADLKFFHPSTSGQEIRDRYKIKGPIVIYAGQLEGANYVDLLLDAVPEIKRAHPTVTFFVLGGGKTLPGLIEKATNDGLNSVIFTDYVPHTQVPLYLAAADIAIACFDDTSVTRCKSPLKIAEYLAAGKAIVASKVGEVIPMVEGCGALMEPGNPLDLATQVNHLLNHPELRQAYSKSARQRAESIYNWSWTVDQLETAYQKALHEPRFTPDSRRGIVNQLLGFSLGLMGVNFCLKRLVLRRRF